MKNIIDIRDLQVGNFYKFVDETTDTKIEFIGYVCRALVGLSLSGNMQYDVAVLQSNDNERLINSEAAIAYIDACAFKGTVYYLDNIKLTFDILEPSTNVIDFGRRK